jgi:DNA-binding NarL/FixJ family response regulator
MASPCNSAFPLIELPFFLCFLSCPLFHVARALCLLTYRPFVLLFRYAVQVHLCMPPIKVSIVEDLAEIREGLISLLETDKRFELLPCYTSAETAAEEMPAWQPDITVMDINLPGMTGIECIRRIKSECPNTQFMMFTIYEDDEKVFEALNAGASGYMLKKTPFSKIVECIVELYEGGSPMSTQIARKVIQQFQQKNKESDEMNLLSPKENEVLSLLAKGFLYKEIGEKLTISVNTVKQHIHKIYQKLHVSNRTEAINKIYRS